MHSEDMKDTQFAKKCFVSQDRLPLSHTVINDVL